MSSIPTTGEPTRQPETSFPAQYRELEERILAFMKREPPQDADAETEFNRLALDVFDFQSRHNPAYANYCQHIRGDAAPDLTSWREIPALPTDAFRASEFPPACFPIDDAQTFFETSGTTSKTPGRHYLWSPALYRHSILHGWRARDLPEFPVAVLTPSPEAAPHSSLSFMMQTIADAFGSAVPETPFLVSAEKSIDLERLKSCIELSHPILLLGTALSFLHLFESIAAECPGGILELPSGSIAMETGGYKGTQRELSKTELYKLFKDRLDIAPAKIINEYGMTELSSQFYTSGLDAPHLGPHWTRIRVIDSERGCEASLGERGHLEITDLANLGSCLCIATRDLALNNHQASSTADGPSFSLIGRDPKALPRGCSLGADEISAGARKNAPS